MKKNVNLFLVNKWFFQKVRENTQLKHAHVALFYWITEKANLNGWADSFYFQTEEAMNSAGFTNWKTYNKALITIANEGIIKILEKSRNQHTPCVIQPCFYRFGAIMQEHSKSKVDSESSQDKITVESLHTLKNYLNDKKLKLSNRMVNSFLMEERYDYLIKSMADSEEIKNILQDAIIAMNSKGLEI